MSFFVFSLAVGFFLVVSRVLYEYALHQNQKTTAYLRTLLHNRASLLVVAHPDDECMFFGPVVQALRKCGTVYVLCLSTGNYYNIGDIRKHELVSSCERLGVAHDCVHVVDHPSLQDGPQNNWDVAVASDIIRKFVIQHNIALLVSFDSRGITGHSNHIATSQATRKVANDEHVNMYELTTLPTWRNYLAFMEVWSVVLARPQTGGFTPITVLSSQKQVEVSRQAARLHKSQMLWFRKLHIATTSYVWINHLIPIKPTK